MSLLDLTENPRDLGLLSLGLRLMSTPGKFGTALGQAGMGALGDMQQAQQMLDTRKTRTLQTQMLEMQLAQQQAAAEEAKRQREADERFRRSIPSPQSQALQTLGADASPTPSNAARLPQVDPRQQFMFDALQAGQIKPMDYFTATAPKAPEYKVVGDSLVQIGGGRVSEAYRPTQRAPMENARQDLLVTDPVTGRLVPNQALIDVKRQLVPPGVSVTYGQPVPGVDAKGNPVFFQPDKGGGAPAIVPGVKPPPQKLGEKQQNQVAGIDAMGQAVDAYVEALGKWKKIDTLNPNRRAEIGTFYNNMMLQAKEAYNLGVLNGPDYAILQDVVRDPLSIMGAVTSNEAMAKQATDLKRIMNKIKAGITKPGSVDAPTGAPKFLGFEPQ
jgi:hypothetical protein